jgi:hypothetical protein
MIVPMLREIRAEIAEFRKEANERLTKLEAGQRNLRSAVAGESVLGRMLVGEFEERIETSEGKVEKLESAK